jgi:hypothetical protein
MVGQLKNEEPFFVTWSVTETEDTLQKWEILMIRFHLFLGNQSVIARRAEKSSTSFNGGAHSS